MGLTPSMGQFSTRLEIYTEPHRPADPTSEPCTGSTPPVTRASCTASRAVPMAHIPMRTYSWTPLGISSAQPLKVVAGHHASSGIRMSRCPDRLRGHVSEEDLAGNVMDRKRTSGQSSVRGSRLVGCCSGLLDRHKRSQRLGGRPHGIRRCRSAAKLSRMDINQLVSALTDERNRIDRAIAALEGSSPRHGRPGKAGSGTRTMSPSARKRISAAMRLRWAQRLGKSMPKKAATSARKAGARKAMSPAARKKLSALARARWAEAKKKGAKTL